MGDTNLVLNGVAVQRALTRVAHEIAERNEDTQGVVLVGIQRGGHALERRRLQCAHDTSRWRRRYVQHKWRNRHVY